jgi:5-methylcytosine-specific restriction endonuclease McrA
LVEKKREALLPFFYSNMKQSKEKYKDLLLSEKWTEKRLKVFKRDGYKCQRCGTNKSLNCHHTYYTSGKKPWEYPLSALLTLCKDCHTRLHSETKIQIRQAKGGERTLGESKNQRKIRKLYESLGNKDREIQKRYDTLK